VIRDLLGASDAVHPDLVEAVHALRATAASAIPAAPIGATAVPLVAKGLGVVGTVVRLGIADGTVQGLAAASFLEPWAGGITKVVNHVARLGVSPERWLLTAFTMAGDEIRELAISAKDSSFELGLALALTSRATNTPVPYDVLATGALDPEGNVTEVAEEDIEHKLRGAWREYGFTRRVLVPQSQVAVARQLCKANLWELEIVGVESVAAALKLVWPAHELRCAVANPDPSESRGPIWRGLYARTRALNLGRRKALLTLAVLVSLLLAAFFGQSHLQSRSSTSRAAKGAHAEYYSHWDGQRAPLPMRLSPAHPARLGFRLDGANRVQAVLVEAGQIPASDDDWVWITYKPLPVVGSQRLDRVHVVHVTSQVEAGLRRILVDIDDDGTPEYRGDFAQGKGELVGHGPLGERFTSCSLSRDWVAGKSIDGAIAHWLLANIGALRLREAGGWYRADWQGWLRAVRGADVEETKTERPDSVPFDQDITSAYAKLTDGELELRFNRWSEPCKLKRRDRIAEGTCASPVVPAVAEPAPVPAKMRIAIDDGADPRHLEGEMRLSWPEEKILAANDRQHPTGDLTFRLCLDYGDGPAPVFRGLLGESQPGTVSE